MKELKKFNYICFCTLSSRGSVVAVLGFMYKWFNTESEKHLQNLKSGIYMRPEANKGRTTNHTAKQGKQHQETPPQTANHNKYTPPNKRLKNVCEE